MGLLAVAVRLVVPAWRPPRPAKAEHSEVTQLVRPWTEFGDVAGSCERFDHPAGVPWFVERVDRSEAD
jgi:hypothetical protein